MPLALRQKGKLEVDSQVRELFSQLKLFRPCISLFRQTMKLIYALAILVASLSLSRAEMQTPIPLWPGSAPGALGTNDWDIPTITPFLPDAATATGAAMVI